MTVRRVLVLVFVLGAFVLAGNAGAKAKLPPHCPSTARIAQLPRWNRGGVLRADMNGDGRPDAGSIRLDRSAPARCAFYLRVSASGHASTLGLGRLISGSVGKLDWNAPVRDWQYQIPALEAIVHLGGRGNLVALADNAGVADLFVDFVGLSHGKLRVIGMHLDLGGSVMDESTASCTRRGVLRRFSLFDTSSPKQANRSGFSVETYRREGWRLVRVAHRTRYGSTKKMGSAWARAVPNRYLGGCTIARDSNF